MASKSTLKLAAQLLDRFFRDAEGRSNRQIDVYFTLEYLGLTRARARPALDFLISRNLLNLFGTDIAYLTEEGVHAITEDLKIAKLPKTHRDFASPPPNPEDESDPSTPPAADDNLPPDTDDIADHHRPEEARITHIDVSTGREFTLVIGERARIGRADGNEICIQDRRASKYHAEVVYQDGRYALVDLESANGTLVNGQYVIEPVSLNHEDEIVIGRTMLLFQAPADLPEPISPPPAPAAEPPTIVRAPDPTEPSPSVRVTGGERVASESSAPEPIEPIEPIADMNPEPRRQSEPSPGRHPSAAEDLDLDAPTRHSEPDRTRTVSSAPPLEADGPPERPQEPPPRYPPSPSTGSPIEAPSVRRARVDSESARHRVDASSVPESHDVALPEPDPKADLESFGAPDEDERTVAGSRPIFVGDPHAPSSTEAGSRDLAPSPEPVRVRDDAATVAIDRPPRAQDDLGYWADQPLASESHPHFSQPPVPRADLGRGHEAPKLDEARLPRASTPSVATAVPPVQRSASARPRSPSARRPSSVRRDPSWIETLSLLRRHVERADLPDRARLLEAIDVISEHPYVRVALNLIDP